MTRIMLATNIGSYNPRAVAPETKIKVLVCNAGSSSLKFSLFDAEYETILANGSIDWLIKPARLAFRRANEPQILKELNMEKHDKAVTRILDYLQRSTASPLQ